MAEHRFVFSVRAMCRCLRLHPSGFYARLKNPLSKRTREDIRQTELLTKAWVESGKVHGYRKLHDDLLDQGETCCPNRVAPSCPAGWNQGPDRIQAAAGRLWWKTVHGRRQ